MKKNRLFQIAVAATVLSYQALGATENSIDDFLGQGSLARAKAVTFFNAEFEDGKVKRLFSETTYSDATKYTALTGLVLKGHEDLEVLILNDEIPTPKIAGIPHDKQQGLGNLDSDLSLRVLGELVPEHMSLRELRAQFSQSCNANESLVRLSLQSERGLEMIDENSELWPGLMRAAEQRHRLFYLAAVGCLKVMPRW